ncbi:uncharacterized protein LOC104888655 [Beta vulgaris subsp. vulgaris]|uniref:uncharacterized protein LOC104888655 n=1 Tax=Beta vulgaris subsp. vulgaris TaxID=3555 RepID=UPI002036E797|nr:uncharacterized protein LOC104888655 [Beta vulgaris subsp. vulgaris]
MACWSPENATKAYIRTLKMERQEKEPNAAEFISALAAGNNAQVMVAACAQKMATPNLLALVSAAQQTGGHVTCIFPTREELQSSKRALKSDAKFVNFVVGDAKNMLLNEYKDADFFLVDCNFKDYEGVMKGLHATKRVKNGVILGYNAFCKGSSWQWSGLRTHLLPIGEGLLVTRIGGNDNNVGDFRGEKGVRKSNWIVKVDKCTGEEHVFRVRSPQRKVAAVL